MVRCCGSRAKFTHGSAGCFCQVSRPFRQEHPFYGDQGIFVRKNVFNQIGAFPEVPVMEDVIFTKKLRKKGKTKVLSDNVIVSPRRIEEKGIIRTFLLYSLMNLMYWFKFPLEKICKVYGDLR